jgi:hypothetical protein
MRNLRVGLTLAFLVIGVLLSGIPLGHAHDTSAPGLYSAQCALYDLGGQAAAQRLAAPMDLGLDVTPLPLALAADGFVAEVSGDPASPRAPPRS